MTASELAISIILGLAHGLSILGFGYHLGVKASYRKANAVLARLERRHAVGTWCKDVSRN